MTTSLLAFFGSFDPFLSRRDSTGLFSAFNLNFWNGYAGWEGLEFYLLLARNDRGRMHGNLRSMKPQGDIVFFRRCGVNPNIPLPYICSSHVLATYEPILILCML
jgi:hypothetical protein